MQTLKEVWPDDDEKVMAAEALIRARFHVIEKDGQTPDGLPVLVSVKER